MATLKNLQAQINMKDVLIRSLKLQIDSLEAETTVLKDRLNIIRDQILLPLGEDYQ